MAPARDISQQVCELHECIGSSHLGSQRLNPLPNGSAASQKLVCPRARKCRPEPSQSEQCQRSKLTSRCVPLFAALASTVYLLEI